jgi:uncharacterized protein (TIGR02453 family)
MPTFFTGETLRFLRALKRNNDREWFKAHRDRYDSHVRAPMVALIERLAVDFRRFAPEVVASPRTSLYRIYRDTRFSEDKTPLKTHVSASFRWRGLDKGGGAGLYLEIHPQWVWIGGGFWAPETRHLVRIREHIANTYPEIDRIARANTFRHAAGSLDGERLTRVPRGYERVHPAADYLKFRQFLAGREFPPDLATSDRFYPTVVATYKGILPLVRFLNEPLVGSTRHAPPLQ